MVKIKKDFNLAKLLVILPTMLLVIAIGCFFYFKQFKKIDVNTNNSQVKISIHPNKPQIGIENIDQLLEDDFYTVSLPDGWSVENVFEPYDIVKTFSDEQYLISSFFAIDDVGVMGYRIREGVEEVAVVQTELGTDIHVLKTPTMLFLASCNVAEDSCYLNLNNQKVYIHLYKVIPGAQAAIETEYPQEVIDDFIKITASMNI